MYLTPNGKISACCLENPNSILYGHIDRDSLKDAFNSTPIKQLRKDLMNNVPRPDVCSRCYAREDSSGTSHRNEYNHRFGHLKKEALKNTQSNGYVKEMKIAYWDFRLSNTCNLRCRTCGPIFSSSWFPDAIKMKWDMPEVRKNDVCTHANQLEIESQMQFAEEMYFAGGEPLLAQQHYDILNKLIQQKRTHVRLSYNSNCTQLSFKGQEVIPLWQQFLHVRISPSIDDVGPRAEYLRKGTKWDVLLANLVRIRQEVPRAVIAPNITVSAFNVLYLVEVFETLFKEQVISTTFPQFHINMVDFPEYYHVSVLPSYLRARAIDRLTEAKSLWTSLYGPYFDSFDVILEALKNDGSALWEKFRMEAWLVDNLRGENVFDTYPELLPVET